MHLGVKHFHHLIQFVLLVLLLIGVLVLQLHVIRPADGKPIQLPIFLLVVHEKLYA